MSEGSRKKVVVSDDPATSVTAAAIRRRRGRAFARKLREFRKSADLTLSDLARRSGLAASTLSKIENGQMSPTYDTLHALAEGLDIDITELVTGGRGPSVNGRKTVTRKGEGVVHSTELYDYELLCTDISERKFAPLLAVIKARSVHSFDSLLRHPGEEFIYVLQGKVTLHTEFYAPTQLAVGDCSYFDSTMGHALVNADDVDARVLWVSSSFDEKLQAAVGCGPQKPA